MTEHAIKLGDERTIRFRAARKTDADLFLGFFSGLSAASRDFMRGWSASHRCNREHAETLAERTTADDHIALVAVDGTSERIVGYCWIDDLTAKESIPILGIGIVDEYHEVGLGRSLLRRMIERGRALGLERIRLGVWEDNARAVHVYESVGFRTDPSLPAREFDGRTEIYMVVQTSGE